MSDIHPAVKEHYARMGDLGSAAKWAGTTPEQRREATEPMRRSRSKVPLLEAQVADLRSTVERLADELAELRAERLAA